MCGDPRKGQRSKPRNFDNLLSKRNRVFLNSRQRLKFTSVKFQLIINWHLRKKYFVSCRPTLEVHRRKQKGLINWAGNLGLKCDNLGLKGEDLQQTRGNNEKYVIET